MFPQVQISLADIAINIRKLISMCNGSDIQVCAVTKAVCGDRQIAKILIKCGAKVLADSRIENLKKYRDLNVKTMLLRLAMLSQVDEVVRFADISLNSELVVIEALNAAAKRMNVVHEIILMIDLGDLREGVIDKNELDLTLEGIKNCSNLRLLGVGTNLSCFGGIVPTASNMRELVEIKLALEKKHEIDINTISGGNSGTLSLLGTNKIPAEINQLRLGASVLLGIGLNDVEIEGLKTSAFILKVEIVEIKLKPSLPIGEKGLDAFGLSPKFIDKGIRKRAICAIGKQDVNKEHLQAKDTEIEILGMSSDNLVIDISECRRSYEVGDIVEFKLFYGGVLSVMTSSYVEKTYLDESKIKNELLK